MDLRELDRAWDRWTVSGSRPQSTCN